MRGHTFNSDFNEFDNENVVCETETCKALDSWDKRAKEIEFKIWLIMVVLKAGLVNQAKWEARGIKHTCEEKEAVNVKLLKIAYLIEWKRYEYA